MADETIKVRLLVPRAGADSTQEIGDELDLPVREARQLLEDGQAEAVAQSPDSRFEKRPAPQAPETRAQESAAAPKNAASGETVEEKPAITADPPVRPAVDEQDDKGQPREPDAPEGSD